MDFRYCLRAEDIPILSCKVGAYPCGRPIGQAVAPLGRHKALPLLRMIETLTAIKEQGQAEGAWPRSLERRDEEEEEENENATRAA